MPFSIETVLPRYSNPYSAEEVRQQVSKWEGFRRLNQKQQAEIINRHSPSVALRAIPEEGTDRLTQLWEEHPLPLYYGGDDTTQALLGEAGGHYDSQELIVWDGGAGNLNFSFCVYFDMLERSHQPKAIVGFDVNGDSLTRGLAVARHLGVDRKVGALKASFSSLTEILSANDDLTKIAFFKDLVAVLSPGLFTKMWPALSTGLRRGEFAIANFPTKEGSYFSMWESGVRGGQVAMEEIILRSGHEGFPVGQHFRMAGGGLGRNFFDPKALIEFIEREGFRIAGRTSVVQYPHVWVNDDTEVSTEEPHCVISVTKE